MAKAKTATVNRTIRIPCSDEEILDAIVEKLSDHYGIAIVAKVRKTGFFRKKLTYSITMTGSKSRVKQADENLISLAKEHNEEPPEKYTVRWTDLPLWAGEPIF